MNAESVETWVMHTGCDIPVSHNDIVKIRTRDQNWRSSDDFHYYATDLEWRHNSEPGDIMEYYVVGEIDD